MSLFPLARPSALQQLAGAILGSYGISALSSQAISCLSSSAAPPGQSAAIIKQLRERSGAPIADVKSVLIEHGWDVDTAYEALRKKGLAAAAKKASRHASEGLVGASFVASGNLAGAFPPAASSGGSGSIVVVELNSETDFVARNSLFQHLLRNIMAAAHALGPSATVGPDHQMDMKQLLRAPTLSGGLVSEAVTHVAAQVRENVRLRRAYRVDAGDGLVYSYVHQAAVPGLGKLASVLVLKPEGGSPLAQAGGDSAGHRLQAAGEGLAMHVAGMRPLYLNRAAVPPAVMEKERELLVQQLVQDEAFRNKAPQVLSKVVEGRLSKQMSEWCLLEQRYVLDDSMTVDKMLARLQKEVGRPLLVGPFIRVQCGEGLGSKAGADFATEVARIVSET